MKRKKLIPILALALALTAQNGTYRFGDGGFKIEVETVSGDLKLHGNS